MIKSSELIVVVLLLIVKLSLIIILSLNVLLPATVWFVVSKTALSVT